VRSEDERSRLWTHDPLNYYYYYYLSLTIVINDLSHRNRYVHHTAKMDGNRTTDLRELYSGPASIYISESPDFRHKVERWHNVLFIAQSTTECSDRAGESR
jgi:hypothetical protein